MRGHERAERAGEAIAEKDKCKTAYRLFFVTAVATYDCYTYTLHNTTTTCIIYIIYIRVRVEGRWLSRSKSHITSAAARTRMYTYARMMIISKYKSNS